MPNDSSTRHEARGCKSPLIVYVMAFFAVVTVIVLPMLSRENWRRPRAWCQNNLKQIGIVLKLYRQDHNGAWPQSFSELYPEYASDLSMFICASSENEVGAAEALSIWSSYEYLPPSGESVPATTVVCREKKSFHNAGKNELFADGHVSYKRDVGAVSK